MDSNLLRTKSIEQLVGDAEHGGKALKRTLTALDLTLLGIGAIIGAGIFSTVGTAAAGDLSRPGAGAALMVSFLITAVVCGFTALCYAEFASMIPIAGSAYTYAYATLGEVFAWMIGWDLILEYAVGSMTVAVGWSGYFQRILAGFGIHLPAWMSASPDATAGTLVNLPAILIVLFIMVLLVVGVRESARFNAAMVAVKLVAVAFFILVGFSYVEPANWKPFMPYGFSGVMTGAAVVFFAYIGFDAVSTTAEEAKNPSRDLPIGIISSLVICTLLYLIVSGILTGIIPVVQFKSDMQFLNAPVGYALAVIHKDWAAGLVSAGAVAGITSVLLVMLMSQPRIFFAMSRDRLLPPGVSKVHPKFRTPYITTIITCLIVAAVAGFVPINILGEMTSIGTLFAFVVVSLAVIVLRIKRPEARRPFRVAGGHIIPVLGVLSCLYLMVSLSVMTWVRFLGWLDIGMVIYWFYGRTHSPLVNATERSARTGTENLANFLKMLGFMLLFNGFCITLLAYLTILNVTNESLAKWGELDAVLAYVGMHVNPEIADAFGLKILLVGAVVTFVGYVLARSSSKR
jgi:basic amino acid/polyamine antiporter, APA family